MQTTDPRGYPHPNFWNASIQSQRRWGYPSGYRSRDDEILERLAQLEAKLDLLDSVTDDDYLALAMRMAEAEGISLERIRDVEMEANGIYTVASLAALPSADEESIVGEGILTRGGKLLIHGQSGDGKTTLAHDLAGCLATGQPWIGRFAVDRPRRVLCVQGELSLPEMASHAQQLVSAGYEAPGLLFARMTDLRLPDGEDTLRELVAMARAEVVILDPFYRLFMGDSMNRPEQVDRVFKVCDALLEDGTVEAVVVVHHSNVTGMRTAHSWVFERWPSTILQVSRVEGVPAQRYVTVQKVRAPSSTIHGDRLRLQLGDSGYRPVVATETASAAGAIMAAQIVGEAGGQLHRPELVKRLKARAGVKDRMASKYLGEAVQAGRLRPVRDGHQALYQTVEVAA